MFRTNNKHSASSPKVSILSNLARLSLLAFRLNPVWSWTVVPLMFVLGVLPVAQVLILREIINAISATVGAGQELGQDVYFLIGVFAAVMALMSLVFSMTPVLQMGFRESTLHRLSISALGKIGSFTPLSYEQPQVLDRLSRVKHAMGRPLEAWAENFVVWIQSLSMALLMAGLFSTVHWAIVLLAVLNSLAFLVAEGFSQSQRYSLFFGQTPEHRRESYLSSLLTERRSLRELHLFGARARLKQRWIQLVENLWLRVWRLEKKLTLVVFVSRLLQSVLFVGSLFVLVRLYGSGVLDVGMLVGILTGLLMFQQAMAMLVMSSAGLFGQGARVGDLLALLLDSQAAVQPNAFPTDLSSVQTQSAGMGIRLERVSFTYPGSSEPSLVEADLHVRPGESIAIVGRNGSGKTTLANILLGIFTPSSGTVTFDGFSGADVHFPLGCRSGVFQSFARYLLSIRDNLGFGYLPAYSDDVRQTCALRCATFELEAEQLTLDSALGKEFGGRELSGGQWQRLALARGLMAPSRLVVLDEMTSRMDPHAESELLDSLRGSLSDRTVVYVAHRLPLARLADRIVVMSEGRIVASGTHVSLLEQGGIYAEFYRSQAEWYQRTPATA